MAQLNIFHYLPGESFIHTMDSRIKLILMILFSITASLTENGRNLGILTLIFAVALMGAKLPLKKLLTELRYFLILIILVISVQSFSISGTPITHFPFLNPSWEGLRSGLLFGWRILLLVGISTILTATTTLSAIKDSAQWLFRPVPFVPEAKVATMISLTITLVPLIFDQASEIMDAQKARCIANRKNPVAKIVFLVFPLIFQTLQRADEIVDAMESRCYSENRTATSFKTKPKDWILLLFSGLVCGIVLITNRC